MDTRDDDSLIVSESPSPVVQRVPFKGLDEDSQVPLDNDTDAESIINEKIEHLQSNEPQLSIRAIVGGLLVGSIMCFSNMYFGLQTGWVTMGSLQSTLLGFGAFALLQKVALTVYFKSRGTQPSGIFSTFGPLENVLLQTTAVATATMPLAGGFVGIIPALNMLPESERQHLNLTWYNLILWGISIAFFGVFFAVPLRRQTILKEKLKFPSGTATAEMIRVLHKLPENRQHLVQLPLDPLGVETPYSPLPKLSENNEIPLEDSPKEWAKKWKVLLYTFVISASYTFLSYFIPILANLPIFSWFGLPTLTMWNWTLTPSLSYVGQGMIMGTRTGISMFIGALLGWAILGPIAQGMNWAPGSVNNWETGAKGWILWVSLSIMLSEALVSLFVLLAKTGYQYYKRVPSEPVEDPATDDQQVPRKVWVTGLIVSSLLCIVIVTPLFHMPIYEPFIAVLFALLVSVLAVRALGETDLNPVSGVGKVSQIIFAVVAPGNIVSNLIAGAIAEAGAQQAGDMMQDLKTGHILKASPRAQFIGQLVGSLVSVFVSVLAFQLYTSAYEIPGPKFQVPTAEVWIDMARLVNGGTLATNVWPFCVVGAIVAGALPIIETFFPKTVQYLPSGIAAAIAMYVTPNWTVARCIGSFIDWIWFRRNAGSHRSYLIIVASGFVLGEGVMSIFTALFKSAGVGVWTCAGCATGFCSGCP